MPVRDDVGRHEPRPRILIVEDAAIVALGLEVFLAKAGFDVCAIAYRSSQALRMAREHRPNALLVETDLRGSVDGIEFAAILRDIGIKTPVIFLSTNAEAKSRVRAARISGSTYMLKPVDLDKVEHALRMALQKHTTSD